MTTTSKKTSKKSTANTNTTAAPKAEASNHNGAAHNLSALSVEDLKAALEAKTTQEIDALKAKRSESEAAIAEIDKRMAALGVTPTVKRRGKRKAKAATGEAAAPGTPRAHNDTPLNQVVHAIMLKAPNKTLPVNAIVEELEKTDYKTNSKNKYSLVHTALKNEELFKKLGRGIYQAV